MWFLVVIVVLITPDGRIERRGAVSAPYATPTGCSEALTRFRAADALPRSIREAGAIVSLQAGCVPDAEPPRPAPDPTI